MTRLKKAAVYIPVCSPNTLAIKVKSPQFLLQSSIALGNFSLFEQGQRKYTTKLQAGSVQILLPPCQNYRAPTRSLSWEASCLQDWICQEVSLVHLPHWQTVKKRYGQYWTVRTDTKATHQPVQDLTVHHIPVGWLWLEQGRGGSRNPGSILF